MTKVFISEILIDESPKLRADRREETISEYAQAEVYKYAACVLFKKPKEKHYYIGDGLHRILAAKAKKELGVMSDVREGGYEEALEYGLKANDRHGLRRSNADKRQCVETALAAWPKHSDRELATICGVHHDLVGEVRTLINGQQTSLPIPSQKPQVADSASEHRAKNLSKTNTSVPNEALAIAAAAKPALEKILAPKDEMGYPIPKALWPVWERRHELTEMMTELSEIKCRIEKAFAENDPLFRGIRNTIIPELTGVRYQIGRFRPYIVCTDCQGHPTVNKSPCPLCYGKGLIGKEDAEIITAKETLDIRRKVISTL